MLPSDHGVTTTVAELVNHIDHTPDGKGCVLHMHDSEAYGVKSGAHNHITVKLPAEQVRTAIADMEDGDVYDPCDFRTCGEE